MSSNGGKLRRKATREKITHTVLLKSDWDAFIHAW